MPPPIVFVSYSHDTPAHAKRVLTLAQQLRHDGFDVRLDQYLPGPPPQGWPRWMLDELDAAQHVLVICTPTYHRRFRGHELTGGLGADWEGAVITNQLYEARSHAASRFLPVLFEPADLMAIPEPLRATTHHLLTSDTAYHHLVDTLLGRLGVAPAPIGSHPPATRPDPDRASGAKPHATPADLPQPHPVPASGGRPPAAPADLPQPDPDPVPASGAQPHPPQADQAHPGSASARPSPSQLDDAVTTWRRRIAYLERELAITSSPVTRFEIEERLAEARANLARLQQLDALP